MDLNLVLQIMRTLMYFGPKDFPPPVDLMGEADGFDVMLEGSS